MSNQENSFGGEWTAKKLECIRKYLHAYMIIMKDRPYTVTYLDAFAGTGYIEQATGNDLDLFSEMIEDENINFIEGSVSIALNTVPSFHKYIFIEKLKKKTEQLKTIRNESPRKDDIEIVRGDANAELQKFCSQTDWTKNRAVVFLDPFGMGVEWSTVKCIADTKAVDLWYLFPLGIGPIRLLVRNGQIRDSWSKRLSFVFGSEEWKTRFYQLRKTPNLFESNDDEISRIADDETIAEYVVELLRKDFPFVAKPAKLFNTRNNPLFLLCFAAGNPYAPAALKIANDLLIGI